MEPSPPHRIVIVGGGFGGLRLAKSLRRAPAQVLLIDKRNFHLFQPLLYQVATGGLSPANIASPLRWVLKRQNNATVLLDEVTGFDIPHKLVLTPTERIPFDSLIVATGAVNFYFNHPEWEACAPGLKTVEEATAIRRRVLLAFEEAERATSEAERVRRLTFVIVGAGPTGVEMSGAIAELARYTLARDFRRIDPRKARIILVEGCPRVLPPFVEALSEKARHALARLGVEVKTGAKVQDIKPDHVMLEHDGSVQRIETTTVIWAAGVRASPVGRLLADATGAALDRSGRVLVAPDLSVPGHSSVFVIGDLAALAQPDGAFLPGVATVAMQEGDYVGRLLVNRLLGKVAPPPFRYHDPGMMATIGRNAAVVDLHWVRFSGLLAWLTWLFVHLINIIEFDNRIMILGQWAWNYFTRNRSARLITGTEEQRMACRPPDS
jgi:NADH dehydrogenase